LKTFITRTITAIFFAIVILGSIYASVYSFGILFLAIVIATQIEFYKLSGKTGLSPQIITGVLTGIVIFFSSFIDAGKLIEYNFFIYIVPAFILIIITELYRKKEKPIENIALTIFGVIYIAVPLSLLNYFVFIPINPSEYNPNTLFGFIFILWIYDSAAYIGGSSFGKHTMFKRISPKKSWEGTIFGFVISCIAGLFMTRLFPDLNSFEWLIVAIITVITGNFGDLFESLFKRKIGIKDSGNILPGHGGILDRFDSLLFAAPAVYFFLKLIN